MPRGLRILLAVALLALGPGASAATPDELERIAIGLAEQPDHRVEAADLFEKVAGMRHVLGDAAAELATLDRLADARIEAARALCQAGEFDVAAEQARKGAALATTRGAILAAGRLGDRERTDAEFEARWDEGEAQLVLGQALAGLGDDDPAHAAYARALELFWWPQARPKRVEALEGMGRAALALGRNAEADRAYEDRWFLARELLDFHLMVTALEDLARAELANGRAAEAALSLGVAIDQVRSLHNDEVELRILLQLAAVEDSRGHWESARARSSEALAWARSSSDAASELAARRRLARADIELERWDEAAEQYAAYLDRAA
ncbi:MAG TPA: hypothetical protein VJS92_07535, partial [Candidatus Polarisedimenticolaceae bacterium]|nr:hypothetical protein [Candidatus Polarisedimenticolaceae bacterium]